MTKRKKKDEDVVRIPSELIHYDEKTGEICIGDECFRVRYSPEREEIAIEVNPDSKQCSLEMRRAAEALFKAVMEGEGKVRFRRIKKVKEEED